jgi:hypothetical protein
MSDAIGAAPVSTGVNPQERMEKLIQLLRAIHEEMSTMAWVALGVLLVVCIAVALVALRWICRGGLASGSSQRFLAEQREISRALQKR